jgi:uncharacterized phiE125 gp8 family phage protein
MNVKVTTDLGAEPLSITEAKAWMRIVDYTSDDTLIESLVKSTRMNLEKYTGLSFGGKTIETTLDNDRLEFELPYGPIVSVTSVQKWFDDEWVTLTPDADYYVVNDTVKVFTYAKFKITYTAGFTTLPDDLLTDIKVLVAWQYKNRGMNFQADKDNQASVTQYPYTNLLNARNYRKVVI